MTQTREAGMRPFLRLLATALLLPLAAGCAGKGITADELERYQADERMAAALLEQPVTQPPPVPRPLPLAPSDPALAVPANRSPAEAETLLAGDPMALRFLALQQLGARGLAPPDEVTPRRDANIGALLPLTAPQPPATGLDRPIPPLDQILDRFSALTGRQGAADKGTDASRAAERGFMLDALLRKQPAARMALSPPDQVAARQVRARLDRVQAAGLITPPEHEAEAAALAALTATLPESATPPAPPPKKKTTAGATGSGRGQRFPGGVSGKLEIVPSPPGIAAPKVTAGFAGPVGVHLLSMGSAGHGDKAWEALKKEFPELTPLSFKVSRADLGDLGATYRLVAGPLGNAAAADKLCADLRAKNQTCQTTPFPQ